MSLDCSNDGCLVADTRIRSHRDLRHTTSLLVAHHGEIVFERYYRRCGQADLRRVHSATTSFISTLDLRGGAWNGGRILGAAYVRAATAPLRWDGGMPEPGSYGLLWWVAERSSPRMYFAAGHGGQYVIVAPELDLVVVTTADAAAVARPKGWLLRRLVMDTIVPAFGTT